MDIGRGQRLKVQEIVGDTEQFDVTAIIEGPGMAFDLSVFGVGAAGKLAGDEYMCFFNAPATPCGGVRLTSSAGASTFTLDLARLPAKIDRLVLTGSIDGLGTMSQIAAGYVRFEAGGNLRATFPFRGTDFAGERALILGEIYRKDGLWRFSATAQGFNGGLDALVGHFGGEVAEPAPAVALPATPKVSLSRVTLTKTGESHKVSLVKGAGAPQLLVIKATWLDNNDGLDNDDLDLRVGILLPDGKMTLVCAPDLPGALNLSPFVEHQGDIITASKAEPATETVYVNPEISRLLGGPVVLVFSVYSAVANGAVSVASLAPVMRMEYGNQIVECAYDFSKTSTAQDHTVYTYAIGTATITGDAIELSPSGATSQPGSENTPWLSRVGNCGLRLTFDGPAVFKGEMKDKESEFNTGNPRRYVF